MPERHFDASSKLVSFLVHADLVSFFNVFQFLIQHIDLDLDVCHLANVKKKRTDDCSPIWAKLSGKIQCLLKHAWVSQNTILGLFLMRKSCKMVKSFKKSLGLFCSYYAPGNFHHHNFRFRYHICCATGNGLGDRRCHVAAIFFDSAT